MKKQNETSTNNFDNNEKNDFSSHETESKNAFQASALNDAISSTEKENITPEAPQGEAEYRPNETSDLPNEETGKDDNTTPEADAATKKKSTDWRLSVWMILPFFLFAIGISLLSIFFFKEYVESSGIWRFAINTNAVVISQDEENNNGEIIGTSMDDFSFAPVLPPNGSTDNSSDVSSDDTNDTQNEQIYYDKKDFPGYRWGDLWAKLSIPAIGLEQKNVYVGESDSIYKKGIGKRFGTRFPGQGGNIVLGAHVTREFYDLSELKIGDRVYIETGYGDYVYEVYETLIFSISDYHYVMNYDDGEKLTMYTCHPRGTAYRTERFCVLCKKISGPEWIKID